jgi:hypothetical protein
MTAAREQLECLFMELEENDQRSRTACLSKEEAFTYLFYKYIDAKIRCNNANIDFIRFRGMQIDTGIKNCMLKELAYKRSYAQFEYDINQFIFKTTM